MNKALLFLLILSVGCDKNQDNKTTSKIDNDVRATIADQLDGYWLSDSYLGDVDSSRSIYDSRNYQTKFWGFRLERENLMSDSATINGFTDHEGGYGGSIKFDSAKSAFVNDTASASEFSFLKREIKKAQRNHWTLRRSKYFSHSKGQKKWHRIITHRTKHLARMILLKIRC